MPFCPKCGSEDVVPIVHRRDYGTIISVLSIFLILFSILYMELPSEFGTSTLVANIMAWGMFFAGIVLLFIAKLFIVNYKCTHCRNKFSLVYLPLFGQLCITRFFLLMHRVYTVSWQMIL